MSFVNIMSDDVWSAADLINRSEALIATEFSFNTVAILNRKVSAAAIQQYTLSAAEQQEIYKYSICCYYARVQLASSVIDVGLLTQAFIVEAALKRVAKDIDDPTTDIDANERQAAYSIINNATQEIMTLVSRRANFKLNSQQ